MPVRGSVEVDEIPRFLLPYTGTHYEVRQISADGVAELRNALAARPTERSVPRS